MRDAQDSAMIAPVPTAAVALDRLRGRLLQQGFLALEGDVFDEMVAGKGNLVVLLLDNPAQRPELFDLVVILPQVLRAFEPGAFIPAFIGPPACAAIAKRFGVLRHPALVFLREGHYVGAIEGLRDWQEYLQAFAALRAQPIQPAPITLTLASGPRS